MVVKVDVDGVLRDMLSAMCGIYNAVYNDNIQPCDVKDYDVDVSFPKCKEKDGISAKYAFFNEYEDEVYNCANALPKAKEAMDILHNLGYHIIIVSHQESVGNKTDTLYWLEEHGIYYDSVCFTKNKDVVKGGIIIDDNPEFLDQITDEGCRKILIDAPYNENCTKYERFYSLYDFVKTLA